MGSKRALPRHGMIDDGTGIMLAQFYDGTPQHIVRRFEGPMDVFAVEFRQFRHECADIAAIRIEFLTLHRVEDAEKGRCIRTGSRNPLSVCRVGRRIGIEKWFHHRAFHRGIPHATLVGKSRCIL